MSAGVGRQHVKVIGFRSQKDAANQDVRAEYVKLADWPCSIETVNAGETRRGQQMQANVTKLVKGNFLADLITTDDQLRVSGTNEVINVISAYDPDGRRRETLVQGRANA